MTEERKDMKIRKGLIVSSVFMIIAGILTWFYPDTALLAAALYLGIMFLIGGSGYLVDFFLLRSGWLLAVGLLNFIIGIILILNLGITASSMPVLLAVWILCVGVMQVVFGVDVRSAADPAWKWIMMAGVLGILFGLLILGYPAVGIFTISALLGFYFFIYGCLGIAEYVEMKKKKGK
ncbi:MAG: DUF308 domain-containing protein [Alphaproteobacteria bacterium]|nr:DUF308 domain-containing protein [Alphaproteobacteria bacterium]